MSQLKKSASFRSRIPIRRQKRSSSPPLEFEIGLDQHYYNTNHHYHQQQQHHHHHHRSRSGNNKRRYDRHYSSSSYSSSDESNESEIPLQMLLKQSSTYNNNNNNNKPPVQAQQPISVSTDAMSLDGLLDSVSSGSFSGPSSPQTKANYTTSLHLNPDQDNRLSSYESLNNCALETLKLTDYGHRHNEKRACIYVSNNETADNLNIVAKPVQGYLQELHQDTSSRLKKINRIEITAEDPYLYNNNNRRQENERSNDNNDDDDRKQKQLSDWYYIKTSSKPKSFVKNPSPYVRRKLPNSNNVHHYHHGSAQSLYESSRAEINPFPVPVQRKFPPKSPVSYARKCYNARHLKQQQTSMLTARIGEITSSSFEHVNIAAANSTAMNFPEIVQEKQFSNNSLDVKATRVHNHLHTDDAKYRDAKRRPLPLIPVIPPPTTPPPPIMTTTQSNVKQNEYYAQQQKQPISGGTQAGTTLSSYRSECELTGSYISLECPASPPGPPTVCLLDNRKDPQAKLIRCFKELYTELALKEPITPIWAQPVAPGVLCPAHLEPELRLHYKSHGLNEMLSIEQLLQPLQIKDGPFFEAPRRVLIECPTYMNQSSLALRIINAWTRVPCWPQRGTEPVALALLLPVHEIKGTISNYMSKEFLGGKFSAFNSAWATLDGLKSKLLFILTGYDYTKGICKGKKSKNISADITELLEGRLYPEARIIFIGSPSNSNEMLSFMQRHVTYEGLSWARSASLLGGGQWGAPARLLDTIQKSKYLRNISRTPFGCLAICYLYETNNCDLPSDEIDIVEGILNIIAPNSTQTHISEFGRLALFFLKTKKSAISSSEIAMYCSAPESSVSNCLDKSTLFGKAAKRKGEYFYNPICYGIFEFLAANYILSLSGRPGLLAAEIAGLAMGESDIDADILKVLTFAMNLLGGRAHTLLSRLTPLWLSPQTIFSLAVAAGDNPSNLNALCDLLGISKVPPICPLESKQIWVQVKSSPTELRGWGMALKSNICALKNLELMYQIEKNMLLESRTAMDIFLDALCKNESVVILRITSLIENDARETEINHLAECIGKAVLKPKLENLELILSMLEEDPPVLKLQPVITALCRSLPRAKLKSLNLDLGLCTSQLVQICSTLEKCHRISSITLPHLRLERGAVSALAKLLSVKQLSYISLPSCWGGREDPSSSSGVSSGSGSSGLLKQGSLTGAPGIPSPRNYPPFGLFSSLPRGALVHNTLGRSATLPRQQMEVTKNSQDSVISRNWYPTPACDGAHNAGTMHDLLQAARDQSAHLHGLDLSKSQLSLEDSMCLGETVRISTTLHSIKLEGGSRISEILPVILGAGESTCLQMLSLSSPRLVLEDQVVAMAARALSSCITLRLLVLDGWTFKVENVATLAAIRSFLSLTSVRELGLSNCRLHLSMFSHNDTMRYDAYECNSVVNLRMAGAQVIFADNTPVRGPQLLPYLRGFTNLRELDISAPNKSSLGNSSSTPLILEDKTIFNFFQQLNLHFGTLNTLKMCNWILHLDDKMRTLKMVAKVLKSSTVTHLKLDGISVMDRPKKQRVESQLIHTILTSIPHLRWCEVSLSGYNEEQIATIGSAICDIRGNEIDIRLNDSRIENAKSMTQSLEMDKFDIRVSSIGTSTTGFLIHAERSGTKGSTRK